MERDSLRDVIADDAYAATFQSLGQYRTAILKIINLGAAERARALKDTPHELHIYLAGPLR